MDGLIVVDKPQGLTSHDVVVAARRCLDEPRVGHTGTLDPLATGVLPLACGRATRLVRFLASSTKDYDATVHFGVTTDSYDITGSETGRSGRIPTEADVEMALHSLRGEYMQAPPAFSAKKVSGRRAYDLARQQRPVSPPPVAVRVSRADLVSLAGDLGTFRLSCSAGFYVRSFAHALGELVGTGACLAALRRTRSGEFTIAQAVPLATLVGGGAMGTSGVVPMRGLLADTAWVRVTDEGRSRVIHGRDLDRGHVADASLPAGETALAPEHEGVSWVRVLDATGELVAMATAQHGGGVLHPSVVLI
jgi:tRNA pseudouridine55 synthase